MTKIDGKAISEKILTDLTLRVKKLKKGGVTPHLVVILIGNNPASTLYVKRKEIKGREIGIKTTITHLLRTITQQQLLTTIKQLNNDNNVHGIIVQRPLPPAFDNDVISKAVLPEKDIDGLHPKSKFDMPLAQAVLRILSEVFTRLHLGQGVTLTQWLKNKKVVVIGKGQTGGGPVINKLRTMNIEPIIIDSKTKNPQVLTKTADIIISSVGKPNIVKADGIKKGVVLISIGLHKGEDGKLHGDYEESEIADMAGFYTPTPGGVGPVNVACLLENLVKAAENQNY